MNQRWLLFLAICFLSAAWVIGGEGCTQPSEDREDSVQESQDEAVPPESSTSIKALDQPLSEKETRTGQIRRQEEVVSGPQSISKLGDWKLYNKHVAFVIHGMGPSRSWSGSSGHLVDASPVDSSGKANRDLLAEIFPAFDVIRVAQATKIQVIEPGGEGQNAVLRVTATNNGVPILDAVTPSQKLEGTIEIDYILRPNVTYLEIVTRYQSQSREYPLLLGDGALFGNFARTFAEGIGWSDNGKLMGKSPSWVAGVSSTFANPTQPYGASYLLALADSKAKLSFSLAQFEILPAYGYTAPVEEKKVSYRRYVFVGKQGLDGMLQALRKLRGQQAHTVSHGKVDSLKDLKQVNLTLRAKGSQKVVSQTFPDSEGNFTFAVPNGDYEIVASAYGRSSVVVPLSSIMPPIKFPQGATLQLVVTEKKVDGSTGGFVPVRVQLTGTKKRIVDLISKNQLIETPPGTYTVMVSRGLEYEYSETKVTLEAGKTTKLAVQLQRAVQVYGVNADMHLHSAPSIDSDVSLSARVGSLVAEGLQFAVATDHDTSTDYRPIIESLQLTPWLHSAIGQEVSPLVLHTNVFPLVAPKNSPTYYGIPIVRYNNGIYQKALTAPQIWKAAKDIYKAQVAQLNHPRSYQAFLNIIRYDREKGVKALPKGALDQNWDTIEVYNGKSGTSDFLDTVMWDWFSFLNQGFFKTAVGNSDTHSLGQRPGIPRTIIQTSTQQADKLRVEEVIANLKAGRAQVYAGPYIQVETQEKKGPGDTIAKAQIELSLSIHAPTWVPVDYVSIYGNGELVKQYKVIESKDKVRFQTSVTFQPKQDTWYVILAGHTSKKLTPVYPRFQSVSMTNPIYLDVDGNGFQAPQQP